MTIEPLSFTDNFLKNTTKINIVHQISDKVWKPQGFKNFVKNALKYKVFVTGFQDLSLWPLNLLQK